MPIECKCLECEKEFKVKPYIIKRGRGKFCCKKCQYAWMSKNNCGEKNPNYNNRWSEDRKKEFSESRMGENNPFYKGVVSEEHKLKLINIRAGKPLTDNQKLKLREFHLGLTASDETKYKMHLAHKGEKSNLWKGGISFLPYCDKFDNHRKKSTRKFFGACICCGNIAYIQELDVHHIDHDKEQGCNGKPFNLVPLCKHCHSRSIHFKEEYQNYINKTLEEGFKWGIWNREEYMEKVMY